MLRITKVKRNSLAKTLGLETGDTLTAFDDFPCEDELDYLYYNERAHFTLTVRDSRTGEEKKVTVEKDEGEDLGLEFAKNSKIRTCQNRCVFCFVDQMPKGMRESLYVKDDDYSMSFACGNFVTLTNLSDDGLHRIVRLGLSPLYVSVHTTNPDLRVKLLRNRHAGKILSQIDTLVKGGVCLHCQAVIVPKENDGAELERTARDLFAYYPKVRDLAFVPTGLTKYRQGLTEIPDVDKTQSEEILELADRLNAEFGVPFLLPADEYFIKAGRDFKNADFYGDFAQIENGVGLTTKFLCDAFSALESVSAKLKKEKKSLIICGVSAQKPLEKVVDACNAKINNLQASVLSVKNEFFGETVTCTGLLTGRDVFNAVSSYKATGEAFDELVFDGNMLKAGEEVFLCGMTLSALKKAIGVKNIRVNYRGGRGLIEILSTKKDARGKKC